MRTRIAYTQRLWRRTPSWRRAAVTAFVVAVALVQLGGSRAAVSSPLIGDWSAPISWPIVAVHMSLTSTGEVYSLDGFGNALNSETLWDPDTGTFRSVPYGRNLFCSGHIQLADGRTMLVGGHISAYQGLKDTTLYDAATNTYQRGADMAEARWYPTATQLPDGRVLAFAGDRIVQDRPGATPPFSDASVNSLPEIYNPQTNTWTGLTSAELTSPLYPMLFVLSGGRIFDAGPDTTSRVLTPGSWTWSTVAASPFDGHSAVMYRPDKIMKSGAWADPDFAGASSYPAHGRTAVIDMSSPSPQWRETAPMAFGRSYHNLTLLPDGTVLASGGGSQSDGVTIADSVLPAEIWNPDTETWTTVDSLTNGRLYHSTALLLPDGRVLMAGGGALPCCAQVDQKSAEIYSPPYLFKGARPTITSAPGTVGYGASFDVTTPDAAAVTQVSLIRLPSVTHAFDQNQRFQFLSFTVGAGKLTVQAPGSANLAPPGDYMLFILNGSGVPSVASFVRIQAAASDTTPPTTPTGLAATGGTGQVALTWGASTDSGGILRYNVHRSTTAGFTPTAANRVAQPSAASYTDSGLAAGTYYYKVTAEDNAGNISAASNEASATVTAAAPAGAVAAYGFDEGSGTSVGDVSGNGNPGTITGASWSASGKFGAALSFDGSNDWVTVADSDSLDLTNGMTIEAWVRPSALGTWRTVLFKEGAGAVVYSLYASEDTQRPNAQIFLAAEQNLRGTASIPLDTWTHLAATYDGSTLRLFVNGGQVSSLAASGAMSPSTGPLRIGGNALYPEWFAGLIDEVRVYNRALTATEIQADMSRSVSTPDSQPPSAPGTLTATGGLGQVSLTWGAATDNVGVAKYNVHRATTAGFTPSSANRIAQPTGTSYTDGGLAAGTYYYKVTAEDAAGNVGPASNQASAAATADTTPPSAPGTLVATAGPGQVSLSWGAASDAGGIARYNVHRGTSAGFAPSAANRIAQPTGTSYVDSGLATGTYYYKVTAEDAAGNVGPASNEASATVSNAPPAGLVAAYGLDEGAGTTTADASGNGNTGTLTNGPTWTTAGKFANAITFDGVNDLVSIADSASLDLTSAMTLEAWVRPTALGSVWRTALLKEQPGGMVYGLYAHGSDGTKVPTGEIYSNGFRIAAASSPLSTNTWAHVAATYDGNVLKVFVNGAQAGQLLFVGSIPASTGALRIGGNNTWAEWFQGQIDEVRIYNRALSEAEIQADMNRPVTNPDSTPPSAPGTLTATGGLSSVQLSWSAATDNVGVARYNVHRGTTAGFSPSSANRIAQPTGTSYTDGGLAAGTYYYKVTAEDAAGNVGPPSNEASAAVTGDTTPPTAPSGLTAGVAGGTVNLAWTAASDSVGVVRYNVHRGTSAGFTPSSANRIAQPTGTSYADAGLATGTYYYKVTAEDAAGNVGPPSNEASATVADATPPTAPSGLTASGSGTSVALSWTAATDNVGVSRYNVHRGTTAGFTPSSANRIAQPTGTSYTDSGRPPGTYYYKVTAEDAAGNVGPPSNEASATIADTTPPTAPGSLSAAGGGGQASLSWTAATDNVGVARYNVHRSTTSGFTPSSANRIAQPTGTSYADGGLAAGTYYYKVTAEDAAGNVGPASNQASATVTSAPTGLVAAYGFDEGAGATTADQSGNGNTGTLTNGPTWATAGKFGKAITFDGADDMVTVADSASLDLTTGMTLEAWVRPTALGSEWRTAVLKEQPGGMVYGLYAHGSDGSKVPTGEIYSNGFRAAEAPSALSTGTWAHIATTYDGNALKVFVNGAEAGQLLFVGAIPASAGALRIGGNTTWAEWFEGDIDEVRIYNRALSAAEIQADMARSITAPDATPPSAPGTLTATGGLGQVALAWGAATDNVGVARYNVHRSTTAGFTLSSANRIAQPTATSYTDTSLAPGTYYYKVTAEDAAGNVGPAGNEASAVVTADTTPPTVSITAPSAGATVSATVTVSASASDNGSVAGVQFKVDGANIGSEDTSAPYSTAWDTFASANGSHTLTAVARDGAGNTTTSGPVAVTVQNTGPPGLVGAWAFDEGTGTSTADSSGKGNNGTLTNATWVTSGKFNKALSFNGTNAWVTVADSATLDLTTGMTLEAWVRPSVSGGWRTVVMKERSGNLAYALYGNTSSNRPSVEVFAGGSRSLEGTAALPTGTWSHLGTTYDGAVLRIYVNGSQASQLAVTGSILTSTGALRIGGNGVWSEWFNGLIDEVRVYNRALSAGEIQSDMLRSITPDTVPPTVTAMSPPAGSAGRNVGSSATATFSESMNPGSITSSTFVLRDAGGTAVPATVSYDAGTQTATLTPQSALQYGATYTATIKGGSAGAADLAGNVIASDVSWSFSTEASPPQILVVGSTANPFGLYLGDILQAEGLNAYTTIDVTFVSPALLAGFDVVVLGNVTLSAAQVTALSGWVNSGGNLIAMRPDKQLAGLLGLTDSGTTLANAYLQVNTATGPGAGIVGTTIQFHGTADRYALNGATAVATLYSNASTATTSPAVTLRAVGSSGGQAAAFAYDLARSVVYTRQGNPAWATQERDGVSGIRPDDMFYGARAGDVQPDWIDTSKIAIPQADEQQRLLVNLITVMERDRMPMPHFWYLPRGLKAAVVMSGDDHSPLQAAGGTVANFDRFKQLSPPGCVVANWACVRSTSYIYPDSVLTNAQAAAYLADGFEIGLHPNIGSCPTTSISADALGGYFDTQLASWKAKYTSQPSPVSNRTHCVFWPDWISNARVELARGMRMDANYYHYPGPWIGAKPGFMTGGGFPMPFADVDGTRVDIFQGHTHLNDEAATDIAGAIASLLDNAVGATGYYGAFGMNMHNDNPSPHPGAEAIIAAAQARGVPVISYKQLLDWTDGRNSSTIRGLSWNAGTMTFVTTVGAGANGLQTLLPTQGPAGTLTGITCGGTPRSYSIQTIKGIQYAMFAAVNGTCQATYA